MNLPRIKKVKKTKNEFIFAGDVWVRNFLKIDAKPLLENNLLHKEDLDIVINNERSNHTLNLGFISEESYFFPKVVIISDGYNFSSKHLELKELEDVCIIAVNKALKKWDLIGETNINFYVVNNPYMETKFFLPKRYFPTCVASSRTNFNFLNQYPGMKLLYEPTPEKDFGHFKSQKYYIDDYRNPVSAALCLAYRFGASKIALMCCDDSFDEKKSGAVKLDNDLWSYPQHIRSQKILDTQAFWLEKENIRVANYSSGVDYANAAYIKNKEDLKNFFTKEE